MFTYLTLSLDLDLIFLDSHWTLFSPARPPNNASKEAETCTVPSYFPSGSAVDQEFRGR